LPFLLSEQHPREQGLKLSPGRCAGAGLPAFRATSKRTRIETGKQALAEETEHLFQSNIQENKD